MRQILAWILTIEIVGWAAVPILRLSFNNRRDAALLSRPLGLALVAYAAWVLTLGGLPFERGVLMLALLAMGVLSLFVQRRVRQSLPGTFWGSEEKRAALLFWGSASVFLVIRAAWPEILGQEKFMDLAFLNSLTRNVNMPPVDPWMSGHGINYYYWGYLLAAAATKLAGISTFLSYNLAVATFAGYSFVAAACLGFRLSNGRPLAGIAAAAATVFAGNLAGAFDGWDYFLGRGFDYFHASRVIASGDTINEFPFFTFFHADLHPHLLAFPYFLAVFPLAHRFLVREDLPATEGLPPRWQRLARWFPAILLAFTAGTAIAANLWVLPAVGLTVAAVGLLRAKRGTALPQPAAAVRGLLGGAILVLAAYELWWSYENSFSLTSRNPNEHGLARNTMTSGLIEFLGVWGILFAVGLVATWSRPASSETGGRRRGLLLAIVAAISLLAALLLHAPALLPLVLLSLGALRILWEGLRRTHDADQVFTAFLLLLGLAMIAGCEFVHFKDSYGDRLQRMNTIFKFYNQAWPLIAIPVVVLAERIWREAPSRRRQFAWILTACAIAAMFYPAAAIAQRARQHQGAPTLDGRRAFDRRNPADGAAVAWGEKNLGSGTVLLEATGDPYSELARVSTHTGVPAVMGWANHEGLWRENDPEVAERVGLIRVFYTTRNPAVAYQILQKYRVTHVVLGELESRTYPDSDAIGHFPFLQAVFPGSTTIFQVVTPRP